MNGHRFVILCCIGILISVLLPAASAVDPLWIQAPTTSGELSCVVISQDGSTIVAGGDQLLALSRDGRKLFTGWSGSPLVISRDGNYILTYRDQTFRLFSDSGTLLWDMSLGDYITEVTMTPDASLIAAGGGNRIRVVNRTGTGIRQNTSIPVNHIRFFPADNPARFFPEGTGIVITTKNGIQTSNLTLLSGWTDTNMTQDFVEIAADGSSFVSVTNNRIRLYTRDGTMKWERSLPGGNALASAYSRDGSTIVIGKDDNRVQVLDHNGTLLWTAQAANWITSVAVSDDGNTIGAGSMDKTISVYDRAGVKLGSYTTRNAIRSHSVAMSGDGSVIAAVDESVLYVFSRSQFSGPAPAEVTTTVTSFVSPTTFTTTPSPLVPFPAGTPQACISLVVPLVVLPLFVLCRSSNS